MPRIFVGNFEFEHELIHGARELSREAKSVAADLVSTWIALADEHDIIWSPTGAPTCDFREVQDLGLPQPRFVSIEMQLPRGGDWELVPWGWTPHLLKWGEQFRWHCPAPPIDVIRLVNSRAFRWQLEAEFQEAIPGSGIVTSIAELKSHLANNSVADAGWVIKANYGMSGRERCLGRGGQLTEAAENWVAKRLKLGEPLVFEPWLNRMSEVGLQWQIPQHGAPQFVGLTELITDAGGTYRGSGIAPLNITDLLHGESPTGFWESDIEVTRKVAERLQQIGYWGPMGIDAMCYHIERVEIRTRPLQDLNARYTMGRLALGWQRWLPSGYCAQWIHDRSAIDEISARAPEAKVIQTSARSWLVLWPVGP